MDSDWRRSELNAEEGKNLAMPQSPALSAVTLLYPLLLLVLTEANLRAEQPQKMLELSDSLRTSPPRGDARR
jgi:hypothetical protein